MSGKLYVSKTFIAILLGGGGGGGGVIRKYIINKLG